MNVDPDLFWNILLTLVIMPLGYFLRKLTTDLEELERRITDCQINMTHHYVKRDDYHRDIDEVKGMLSDIFKVLREERG